MGDSNGPPAKRVKTVDTKYDVFTGPLKTVPDDAVLFAGTANIPLAEKTAKLLGIPLGDIQLKRFADGEINMQVQNSVRDKHVYIVQPVCRVGAQSVNDSLMELLLLVSTMKRASASRIVAIIPYYGYARQDRKVASRTPISAADVAHMITSMGVDRVICVDLHCGQIQGFFPPSIPVDNLSAGVLGAHFFAEKEMNNPVVVSPDAGGVAVAKTFRRIVETNGHPGVGLAMLIKQRVKANEIERMDLVGSVKDADCIIVDDIVDTAGTLCEAARQLQLHGARKIYAFITHGLLNGPACERIQASTLDELVVTDTTPLPPWCESLPNLTRLSIAPMLAETLRCHIERKSLGKQLFG